MAASDKDAGSFLITDCGSTTTKAILIERQEEGFRLRSRGEAPTTVEAPHEDVTRGVQNAVAEIEELTGNRYLMNGGILSPQADGAGVDQYLSTSSAGGGLQMTVAGVVKNMTGQSAARAALGAGAIVIDVFASNDGRPPHEKIARIRELRPDMILLSGGVDGGTVSHVLEMAELIKAANPRPRLGMSFKLPVIYAGNRDAADMVSQILCDVTDLDLVENVRPVLEHENLQPAREKIHDLFMEHVMAQAPGYKKLMSWAHAPIMPTPGAVGSLIRTVAQEEGISVIGVDIGGATTDVFSVFKGVFNRTVSANLGMSYSVSNVLAEAGIENILRWLPFDIEEHVLRNRIGNKMIRPTTIPQTLEDLKIEQAIAREALRLSFVQHRSFAVGLEGVQSKRSIADAFEQVSSSESLVSLMDLDLLIGSGGVLSHAPRRVQAARMMIDAFLPEGITEIAVDSIFMMPHLGVLSTVNVKAAAEVFHKDCLVRLGTCVAPVGRGKKGKPCMEVTLHFPGGAPFQKTICHGEFVQVPLAAGEVARAEIDPARGMDMGAGRGGRMVKEIRGGVLGVILDGRGRRPFDLPIDTVERMKSLQKWGAACEEYPDL
jgi:uncharacterized protein (TIGR01319 family)